MSNTKICSHCHLSFPLSSFYKNRRHPDGLSYLCKQCDNTMNARWKGQISFETNRRSPLYFGIIIAEPLLLQYFGSAIRSPPGTAGYDYTCTKGYKIDVKAACRETSTGRGWLFSIRHNIVADYFLCIGFDSREQLNPQRVWLIPGSVINHVHTLQISNGVKGLARYVQYELPVDKILQQV